MYKTSIDVLLAMPEIQTLCVSGDGIIHLAPLITGGYLEVLPRSSLESFVLKLTDKGQNFIDAWKKGDQRGAV